MLLATLLSELVAERPVEAITEAQYDRSVRCFSAFLGKPATIDDLRPELVNQWLAVVAKRSAPRTVLGRKRGLTPIWNYATERQLAQAYETRRLRRVAVPHSIVEAWSIDQVDALFAAAKMLPGQTACGIPASLLMTAVCSIAYETGIRPSDWRELTWDHVDFDRRIIRIVQHKTGNTHVAAFSKVSERSLKNLHSYGRVKVFPVGLASIRRWEKLLFDLAKRHYGFQKKVGQALGTLRKSHATNVYLTHGESAAAASLGHVSGTTVVVKHYIDSSAKSDPIRLEMPNGRRTERAIKAARDRAQDRGAGGRSIGRVG